MVGNGYGGDVHRHRGIDQSEISLIAVSIIGDFCSSRYRLSGADGETGRRLGNGTQVDDRNTIRLKRLLIGVLRSCSVRPRYRDVGLLGRIHIQIDVVTFRQSVNRQRFRRNIVGNRVIRPFRSQTVHCYRADHGSDRSILTGHGDIQGILFGSRRGKVQYGFLARSHRQRRTCR